MPYTISTFDTSNPINFTVQDGVIDSSSLSISLIGTNAQNYADEIARNDLNLLENFASEFKPTPGTTLVGQLWYDKTDNVLRVYKGRDSEDWVNLEPLVSATAPVRRTPRLGERYFDTSNNKLYIHDGGNWISTNYGGEVTSSLSSNSNIGNPTKFGAKVRAIFLKDTSGNPRPCLALISVNNSTTNELYGGSTNGETIMAIFNHTNTFQVDNVVSETEGEQINYYAELNATGGIGTTINKGMNLRKDYTAEAVALATEAITAQKANALFRGGQVVSATSIITDDISWIPAGATGSLTLGNETQYFDTIYVQRIKFPNDGNNQQAEIETIQDNLGIIGSSVKAFADIYTYDLHANANVNVGVDGDGNLNVTGKSYFSGDMLVSSGNVTVNKDITSGQTITGDVLTDSTLSISSGSITSGVAASFSGKIDFGSLNDGAIEIQSFVDEDNMLSNSPVRVPTQQSTKAYVDTANANMKIYVDLQNNTQDLDFSADSGSGTVLIGGTTDSQSMTFTGGDGITSSASNQTLTIDVDNTVVRTSGAQSIAGIKTFSDDANFSQDVQISGNLNVSGTQTTVNTATLSVADNEITLNSDATGTPSENAGIEVERGSFTNVRLRWNESTDKWQFTNDGSTYSDITTYTNFSVSSGSASGNGALSYNNSNGVFTFTPADTSLSNKTTDNLAQGSTNLYYNEANVLSKIQATTLTNLSDVNYSSPNNGQALMWNSSTGQWEATSIPGGISTLVNLTDVNGGASASTGQVLQKLGNGAFGFGTVSTTNNYVDGLSFNTGTGVLTATRNGLSSLTANLDGRYGTSSFSGSWNDLTNKPTLDNYVSWSFDTSSNGTDETVTSGDVVRFSAGTGMTVNHSGDTITFTNSSPDQTVALTGAGSVSVSGTYPSFTITGTDNNNTYSVGSGLSKSTSGTTSGVISHADTSSVTNLTPTSRTYVTELTFDTFGHVIGYDTAQETVTNTDTNYYTTSLSFNASNGVLTVNRSVIGAITVNLDGRYGAGTSNFSGSYNDLTNKPSLFSGSYNDLTSKPTIYAEPGIFSGGGTPTLASGVLGSEIRTLIGAGTSSSDTTYSAGTGLTLNGTQFNVNGSFGSVSIQTTGNINGSTISGNNGNFGSGYFSGGLAVGGTSYTSNTIRCSGDIIAYYSSDKRLKDNITPIEDSLEKIGKLKGYEFDWNDKQEVYEGHDIGVIAQEVEEVAPELVETREHDGYKAVKYEKLTALLINAVNELKAEVDELKLQLRK